MINIWIHTTATGTARLHDAELDVTVEFSTNQTAQVERDVGEALCDKYAAITEHDTSET